MNRSEAGERAQKWYNTARWKRMRKRQLAKHPHCQCPHHQGKDKTALATVADHKIPHRGDTRLFWDSGNLQSLTKVCHDTFKHSQDSGGAGFLKGCDVNGMPLSPDHPWRQA